MSMTMKVMTFNLRVAVPFDPFRWDQRKEWAAQIMERYAPDLIGTQEATVSMLSWLKERFSDTYDIYGVNRTTSGAGEFSAVFVKKSKFAISRKHSFMLSETPDIIGSKGWDAQCERICSWVELTEKNSTEPILRFFNTHLDHIGKIARKEGLKLILQKVMEENRSYPLPVVITGDFNDVPGSGLLEEAKKMLPMASCYDILSEEEKKQTLTFHGYRGGTTGSPIDYILCDQPNAFLSTTIIRDQFQGGYPSDHYPVISRLQIEPGLKNIMM